MTATAQTQRRIRPATPLERTRQPPPPLGLPPTEREKLISYVLVNPDPDGTPASDCPPMIRDPKVRRARRRCLIWGEAVALERWMVARVGAVDLAFLIPLLAETLACMADTEADYAALVGRWEAGTLAGDPTPLHPFTEARNRLEVIGAKNPDPDLPAEDYVDIVLEIHRLTGLVVDQEAEGWTDADLWGFYEGVNRCVAAYEATGEQQEGRQA